MSVLAEIRAATRPIHDELEGDLDIVRRLASIEQRKSILCRFYAIHSVAEAALLPQLCHVPDLAYEQRRKAPILREDLLALGVERVERCLERSTPLPVLGCVEQALGFAYVLEGSILGGRVIRMRVAAAGGSLLGLGFFDIYGSATGDQWKQFCAVLERQCKSHVVNAVEGALAGFGFVRATLLDGGEVAADRGVRRRLPPQSDGNAATPR